MSANEKVIEYRNRILDNQWKWQFGRDTRSIRVYEITDNTVHFFDGHRDPTQAHLFKMTLNEFSVYLADNNAKTHWTIGA